MFLSYTSSYAIFYFALKIQRRHAITPASHMAIAKEMSLDGVTTQKRHDASKLVVTVVDYLHLVLIH